MKKATKYILGAGAAFLAGAATCYLLVGDVKGLWDKTKYVYCKAQRAMMEYDEQINGIKPETVKKIDDIIIDHYPGTNAEDAKQRRQEIKDVLDEKIENYEKEKK